MSTLLNISEAAALALHTVVLLATKAEEVVSTRVIAESIRASEAHLSKVLQRLSRVRLVRSIRGPKGGFVLARPADKITMLEVFEAIEGPFIAGNCLFRQQVCDGSDCILGDSLKRSSEYLRTQLSQSRVADVVDTFARITRPAKKKTKK